MSDRLARPEGQVAHGSAVRKAVTSSCWRLTGSATLVAIVPLLWILAYVVRQGLPALNLDFFTHLPTPVGVPGGGIVNAIVGSAITVGIGLADRGAGRRTGGHLRGHASQHAAGPGRALRHGRHLGRALHRDGHLRLHPDRAAAASLLRSGRAASHWPSSCCRSSSARRKRCCGWCPIRCAKAPWRWARRSGRPHWCVVLPAAGNGVADRRDAGRGPRGG